MTAEQAEAHDELRKTIAKQDALIKQLGEALRTADILATPMLMRKPMPEIPEAIEAYNNYLRERGE